MTLNTLPAIVTLLIALSVATERAVEIFKSMVHWLNTEQPDPRREGRRRAALQALAVVFGVVITWVTWPVVAHVMGEQTDKVTPDVHVPTVLALGLLSSGGSGFWNSILTYFTSVKELKRAEVATVTQSQGLPNPTPGSLTP